MRNKKRERLSIKINLSNRWLYFLITLGILAIIGVGVYALTPGTKPNPGHDFSELGVPSGCAANQTIIWNGTNLACSRIITKIIAIGDWNMDSTQSKYIQYGVSWDKIVRLSVIIRADSNAVNKKSLNLERCGVWEATPPSDNWLALGRTSGGWCDNTDFDATSYNRGWIYIEYEA